MKDSAKKPMSYLPLAHQKKWDIYAQRTQAQLDYPITTRWEDLCNIFYRDNGGFKGITLSDLT